jgi:hypothetical protein
MTAAELKMIEQVCKDGTLPARYDFRTLGNLQSRGEIHFSVKRGQYRVGPEPKEA